MHDAADPDLFIPVHGEYSHLVAHHELALERGMAPDRVLRCTDGDRVKLDDDGISRRGRVSDTYVMVDESGNPVSEDLLEERRNLSGEGFVVVRVVVDGRRGKLVGEPFVETRGWVEPSDRESWCGEVAEAVSGVLKPVVAEGERDSQELARLARRATGRLVSRRTGRRPALVPVVEVR